MQTIFYFVARTLSLIFAWASGHWTLMANTIGKLNDSVRFKSDLFTTFAKIVGKQVCICPASAFGFKCKSTPSLALA
jgi:hypothetical protein